MLVWLPGKKARKAGRAVVVGGFQRAWPSSVRRRLAASLVLEFYRREWGRSWLNGGCPRDCATTSLYSG